MNPRADILKERAGHLCQIILHLQGDSSIVHESNKYLGALTINMARFESDENLNEALARERQWKKNYSEEDALKDFEFRIERASIAIENYANRKQFNCGYWHPLEEL